MRSSTTRYGTASLSLVPPSWMNSAVTPAFMEFTLAMNASGNEFSRPRRTPMCITLSSKGPRETVLRVRAILHRDPGPSGNPGVEDRGVEEVGGSGGDDLLARGIQE